MSREEAKTKLVYLLSADKRNSSVTLKDGNIHFDNGNPDEDLSFVFADNTIYFYNGNDMVDVVLYDTFEKLSEWYSENI